MDDAGPGEIAAGQTLHAIPRPTRATALTAPSNGIEPMTSHLIDEATDRVTIARHGMIIQPALYNTSKPLGRFHYWPMHSLVKLLLDCLERCSQTLGNAVTLDGEPTVRSRLGTLVCEAKKIERFRSALPTRFSPLVRKATELDQTRFALVKFQAKLGASLPEFLQAGYRFGLTLETDHEVVSITDYHHIVATVLFPPPIDPQVEHVMQVNVGQEWGNYRPLWRPYGCLRPLALFHDPGVKPFADQAKNASISDSMLQKLD